MGRTWKRTVADIVFAEILWIGIGALLLTAPFAIYTGMLAGVVWFVGWMVVERRFRLARTFSNQRVRAAISDRRIVWATMVGIALVVWLPTHQHAEAIIAVNTGTGEPPGNRVLTVREVEPLDSGAYAYHLIYRVKYVATSSGAYATATLSDERLPLWHDWFAPESDLTYYKSRADGSPRGPSPSNPTDQDCLKCVGARWNAPSIDVGQAYHIYFESDAPVTVIDCYFGDGSDAFNVRNERACRHGETVLEFR